jgi:hypothetical protein
MSKKTLTIIIVVALIVAGYFLVYDPTPRERVIETATVANVDYGLNFEYAAGADGYELIASATQDNALQSYVLIEKAALATFQAEGGETAPPTISVFVFQLPEEEDSEESPGRVTRLQNWAQANAGLTSFTDIYGTPKITEIDGVKALEYLTDGVYQQTIYLASYRGFVYMFGPTDTD